MSLNLYLPSFEPHKGTVKDFILAILADQWPLAPKRIYFVLKKRYAKSCTYQAVFKSLTELREHKIVVQTAQGYHINLDWIKELQSYTDVIETNYYAKEKVVSLDGVREIKGDGDIQVLTFTTYFDAEKYLYYFVKYVVLRSKQPQKQYRYVQHEWRPLFYLRTEYQYVQKLRKGGHQLRILSSGKGRLDKHFLAMYNEFGVQTSSGCPAMPFFEAHVSGDYFIQVYVPTEITEALDEAFALSVTQLKISHLIDTIFLKPCKVKVMVNKDRDLAAKMKKEFTEQASSKNRVTAFSSKSDSALRLS
ncbi:hypothetical protein HY639_01640 [Candidatus Woesearchaeota archaeon]|nr:hypothetical protein [Candidatus Woesearchaeota archaeon]